MSECTIRYFFNSRYEGMICPELAQDIMVQASKQKWSVFMSPTELKIWFIPGARLY